MIILPRHMFQNCQIDHLLVQAWRGDQPKVYYNKLGKDSCAQIMNPRKKVPVKWPSLTGGRPFSSITIISSSVSPACSPSSNGLCLGGPKPGGRPKFSIRGGCDGYPGVPHVACSRGWYQQPQYYPWSSFDDLNSYNFHSEI